MKTILLLGGFGFIGTNILGYIDRFAKDKYQVIVFDRLVNHPDHIRFDCVLKTYAGDFSDEYLLKCVFQDYSIDLVIHSLSASVPSSSKDNAFDLQYNVLPTISLLNTMTVYGVGNIVFISSGGAIYGDHYVDNNGHREDEVLFPKSAYGISKLIVEKYLYLYMVQYGMKSLILRLSNPYGPYHYSQKQGIINIALEAALYGRPFQVWGDGEGKKDYIYIDDFCKILMLLIEQEWKPYQVINVGSGNLLTVNQIVNSIKTICPNFVWSYKNSNAFDVQDFRLNLSLLQKSSDCSMTSLEEGLKKTMEWYESRK